MEVRLEKTEYSLVVREYNNQEQKKIGYAMVESVLSYGGGVWAVKEEEEHM